MSSGFSRLPRPRHWAVLVLVLVILPLLGTRCNIRRFLAKEGCVLYKKRNLSHRTAKTTDNGNASDNAIDSDTGGGDSNDGLACRRRGNGKQYFVGTESFVWSPPSIARLATTMTVAASSGRSRGVSERNGLNRLQQDDPTRFYRYDYATEEESSSLAWLLRPWGSASAAVSGESPSRKAGEVDPAYGFRRNPNKASSSFFSLPSPHAASIIPVATYFWLALNVGLYLWYLQKKVDPGTVALNRDLLSNGGDFGRAFSGNLAHFEIWHLGLNAMSLVSLGEALETDGGTIPLVLWTASLLALVTLGVVGLYGIDRRFGGLWRRPEHLRRRFPNMVGFSGVLFAWSVYRTLSLPEYQATCPIPFFSGLCFQTHRFAGGLRFSWGPLVQLVVVQVVLGNRVSFVGHLSGALVGFLWHWGVLPPLEFSQPSISYPVLWIAGKHALYRWGDYGGGSNSDEERGYSVVGTSSWAGGNALENNNGSGIISRCVVLLRTLQKFAILLTIGMLHAHQGFSLLVDDVVLSEFLMLVVFSLFVRAAANKTPSENGGGKVHPLACTGSLGRAYVAFAVVALVTDSMTLGGWWAVIPLWHHGGHGDGEHYDDLQLHENLLHSSSCCVGWHLLLAVARCVFWVLSASAVCHTLECGNELQLGADGNCFRADGGGGIWTRVFGWSVVGPLSSLGKALTEPRSTTSPWATRTPTMAASTPPSGVTAGGGTTTTKTKPITASNLAGKSRLVDRSGIV